MSGINQKSNLLIATFDPSSAEMTDTFRCVLKMIKNDEQCKKKGQTKREKCLYQAIYEKRSIMEYVMLIEKRGYPSTKRFSVECWTQNPMSIKHEEVAHLKFPSQGGQNT